MFEFKIFCIIPSDIYFCWPVVDTKKKKKQTVCQDLINSFLTEIWAWNENVSATFAILRSLSVSLCDRGHFLSGGANRAPCRNPICKVATRGSKTWLFVAFRRIYGNADGTSSVSGKTPSNCVSVVHQNWMMDVEFSTELVYLFILFLSVLKYCKRSYSLFHC